MLMIFVGNREAGLRRARIGSESGGIRDRDRFNGCRGGMNRLCAACALRWTLLLLPEPYGTISRMPSRVTTDSGNKISAALCRLLAALASFGRAFARGRQRIFRVQI
jgi:hypothetical protein